MCLIFFQFDLLECGRMVHNKCNVISRMCACLSSSKVPRKILFNQHLTDYYSSTSLESSNKNLTVSHAFNIIYVIICVIGCLPTFCVKSVRHWNRFEDDHKALHCSKYNKMQLLSNMFQINIGEMWSLFLLDTMLIIHIECLFTRVDSRKWKLGFYWRIAFVNTAR